MGNVGSTAIILFIVVMFLAGLSVIIPDITKNSNLDNSSLDLATTLNSEYNNNYNVGDSFAVTSNNVTANSSSVGIDAFARQFFENKQQSEKQKSTIDKVLTIPELFLKIFGVTDQTLLDLWNTAIIGLISFFLVLYIYKFVRTGEVD